MGSKTPDMRSASYIRRRGFVARACVVLLLVSALALFFCLGVGSAGYALSDVWQSLAARLSGSSADATAELVLWRIRLPRSLLAYLVGAALAVSGVLMQGVFRNPMAEPGLLGVSSGAALGAAAAMLLGLQSSALGFSAVSVCAFAGGAAAVALVMFIARAGRGSLTSLLLCGVAVSSFLSALLSGLLSINHEAMESVYMWTLGSFASANMRDVLLVGAVLAGGLLLSLGLARDLNAISAGSDARLLGVNAPRVRLAALLLSTLMTAAAVSVSGVIGFVGLTAPHVIRRLTGADHRSLLPLSALAGGLFLLLADALSRTLFAPAELPVGVTTSLFGGPFFLILIRRYRGGRA